MAKPRQKKPASEKPTPSGGGQPLALDPLRSLWLLSAIALVVILSYSFAFPQEAYPRFAIMPSVGMVILTIAAMLIVARSPWLTVRALLPVLFPCVFFLWALWRTATARVPSEGIMLLGTLFEGCLVFSIALVLAAVGKHWHTFRPDESSGLGEGKAKTKPPSEPPRLLENSVIVFAVALAMGMALWAVYQYFILYEVKFARLYNELITVPGRTFADLSRREWDLLAALNSRRVSATFGNPNVLAGFLAMVVPLAVGAAVSWRDRGGRIVALAALGVFWYVVLLTRSRGGLLTVLFATAAAMAVVAAATWRTKRLTMAVAGAVCAAAIVLAAISGGKTSQRMTEKPRAPIPARSYSFIERLFNAPTVAQRVYYLESAWRMIRKAPLLGQGFGSYAVLYPTYKQPKAREARYPHNILCHYWVETGLVGLALWAAWVGVVLARAVIWLRRSGKGSGSIGVRVLLVAAVVFLFNNLFEMTWAFREAHLFWCLIMGALAGLACPGTISTEQIEKAGASRSLRVRLGPMAVVGFPMVLAVALGNSVLLKPLVAKSCQFAANDLLAGANPDYSKVMRLAHKMIRFQPKNPWYHHWLAIFHMNLGQFNEARYEFKKALALYPESAQIHADFAAFEQKTGRPDEARRLYAKATELYPQKTDYFFRWAQFEKDSGKTSAALRLIERAINRTYDNRERARYIKFRRDLLSSGTSTTKPSE